MISWASRRRAGVFAVEQEHLGHVNGPLVVGNHHDGKIMVGVTSHGRGPHVAVHFFHAAHQRFCEFGVRVSGRSRVVVLSRRVGRLGLGAPIEAESAECE